MILRMTYNRNYVHMYIPEKMFKIYLQSNKIIGCIRNCVYEIGNLSDELTRLSR